VTKFGGSLLASPTSIFNLIPPFCPADSALKKQFASSSRSMTVSGLAATTWDDCSSTITFQQDTPSTLACSSQFFCVGLTSGHIKIYDESTCQDLFTLKHGEGEGVRDLQFSENESLLASVAPKSICVWNVHTREQLWKLDLEFQC
jgi:WD40 repeat protein